MNGMPDREKPEIDYYSRRLLSRNVAVNFVGQLVPLIVAVAAMPYLVRSLGVERFGILTLAWMVVGYFSVFDMGVGRATTKYVAEYIAVGNQKELPRLIWTSLAILLGVGALAGLILYWITPVAVTDLLKVPPGLAEETTRVFRLLSFCIPFILGTAGSRGVLEAQQKFGVINLIKVPADVSTFLAPMAALFLSRELFPAVAALVLCRMAFSLIYLLSCLSSLPGLMHPRWPSAAHGKTVLRFGGWLTVSNIVSPFMNYMDRVIIGATLGMTAVAFYATPYDMVTKLLIVAGSLMGVMFPVFSAYSQVDLEKLVGLYERMTKYVLMAMLPLVLAVVVMAEPLLRLWLGRDFAEHSTVVLQILAIGVFINAIARIPLSALHAFGRTDLTAISHLVELPIYAGMLWVLLPRFGIVGVAIAFALRMAGDAALLVVLSRRIIPTANKPRMKYLIHATVALIALIMSSFLATMARTFAPKVILLAAVLIFTVVYLWTTIEEYEKQQLGAWVHKAERFLR